MKLSKRRLSDGLLTLGFFLHIVFRPAYPCVIEFVVVKRSFRRLPSSSMLKELPVFQIWHECRPRF